MGRLKNPGLICAVLLLSLSLLVSCGRFFGKGPEPQPPSHLLVVLHTNDTHGHPVKFFDDPAPDVGGLPARATLVEQIREQNSNVLLLDAGDLNTGRAESNLFKATPDILGYNKLGYDAMALGNHEFDNPLRVLKEQMALASFPFLSANVKTKDGRLIAKPYIIKEFNGFKAAVFGLTTVETAVVGTPEHVRDLLFEDEVAVARRLVPELRKRADVVIALTHMGLYENHKKGSWRLASEVSGIDLIVDGHTHTRLESPLVIEHRGKGDRTFIVQAWQWGLVLGRADLKIRDKKVVEFSYQHMPINLKTAGKSQDGTKTYRFVGKEIQEDRKILELLRPYVDKADSFLFEAVGVAEAAFPFGEGRRSETALGDLVADSMLWYTERLGVDFALTNGGAIRANIPPGIITRRLIYEVLPFDNSLVILSLRGSDVQALFDYIGSISPGKGAFPQVSKGLSFTINGASARCEDILVHGRPIDPERFYRIVTNSYLASGGDGYQVFQSAAERYDTSVFSRDALEGYIRAQGGRVRPSEWGRIHVIPGHAGEVRPYPHSLLKWTVVSSAPSLQITPNGPLV